MESRRKNLRALAVIDERGKAEKHSAFRHMQSRRLLRPHGPWPNPENHRKKRTPGYDFDLAKAPHALAAGRRKALRFFTPDLRVHDT
jgi:hypothetical protein